MGYIILGWETSKTRQDPPRRPSNPFGQPSQLDLRSTDSTPHAAREIHREAIV